jgi:hypothetical protein
MKLKYCLWVGLGAVFFTAPARAGDVKRECVDASTEGQTSRDAGDLMKAREKFLVCSRDACPAVVRSSCSHWLVEAEQQIPSIVVRAADASNADVTDGTATVDGNKYPLDGKPILLDPGKHTVVLDTQDGAHLEKKVLLAAGEKSRLIELRVEGPKTAEAPTRGEADVTPPRKGPPQKAGVPTGVWVLGGVSIVALGSFGFFALSAKKELNSLNNLCSPRCNPSDTNTGKKDALIADISLGVGVAALAGAVTWALLSSGSKSSETAQAQLALVPSPHGGFAALSGRF